MGISLSHIISPLLPGAAAIGLELTDTSVKLAELVVKPGEAPVLKGTAVEPLPNGSVEDGRIRDVVGVMQAVRNAYTKLDTRTKRIHLVLPSQHVMVRFFRFPDIPDREMRKLVDFELKHNIHLPFDDPYYDFINQDASPRRRRLKRATPDKTAKDDKNGSATSDHDNDGRSADPFGLLASEPSEAAAEQEKLCDVMMAAASLELIEEYKEIVTAAGLKPVSMEIKALTLYRVLRQASMGARADGLERPLEGMQEGARSGTHTGTHEGTLLLIDINERGTDVCIYHDGKLKITRTLSVVFTPAPEREDVPEDPLEQLLLGIQGVQSNEDEHTAELVHELERLMNFYRYTLNNRDHEFDRIVVSGDIPQLPKVIQGLRERMSQPVVPMTPGSFTDRTDGFGDRFLSMAVPFGLALRGRS